MDFRLQKHKQKLELHTAEVRARGTFGHIGKTAGMRAPEQPKFEVF